MKHLLSFLFLFVLVCSYGQTYSGIVFMKDNSDLYLNQVYISNLKTRTTILSNYNGAFSIGAAKGDIIRFTSVVSERTDVTVTEAMLSSHNNLVQLRPMFHEIEEVVIRFKPTGILKADVLALKSAEKKLEAAKRIGLPEPKGDGYTPEQPMAALKNGGLSVSIDAIYAAISGDLERQRRLKNYEIMAANITDIKNYFGTEYFTKLKIPMRLIDNFLQFVYTSDNLQQLLANKNYEGTKPYLEKYLPIYLKRLETSQLMQTVN